MITTYRYEYRHHTTGMRVYKIDTDTESEELVADWDVLTGLKKYRGAAEDREDYAQTLAISWAVYTSQECEIVEA